MMRERIARAIEPVWWDEIDGVHILDNFPDQHKFYQKRALERADAVLDALREPTEEMLKAAWKAQHNGKTQIEVWQAMIDKARK